eukprot:scaffold52785_cov48-Cyclotella_meneghiniana.AAC.5
MDGKNELLILHKDAKRDGDDPMNGHSYGAPLSHCRSVVPPARAKRHISPLIRQSDCSNCKTTPEANNSSERTSVRPATVSSGSRSSSLAPTKKKLSKSTTSSYSRMHYHSLSSIHLPLLSPRWILLTLSSFLILLSSRTVGGSSSPSSSVLREQSNNNSDEAVVAQAAAAVTKKFLRTIEDRGTATSSHRRLTSTHDDDDSANKNEDYETLHE